MGATAGIGGWAIAETKVLKATVEQDHQVLGRVLYHLGQQAEATDRLASLVQAVEEAIKKEDNNIRIMENEINFEAAVRSIIYEVRRRFNVVSYLMRGTISTDLVRTNTLEKGMKGL